MTVVPAKMIIVEKEPRFRVRRAPAVGPPSSDLRMKKIQNSNQQSYLSWGQVRMIKVK